MKTPMISVVMPVYNGEKYLKEAIDSILTQTYTDFEFIILNDGSTDKTEEIILSYDDPRIVYVKNEENIQIVRTLNKGIELAKGKYVARMDADDISLPQRLEKQLLFLDAHREVGVCGSWMEAFSLTATSVWKAAVDPDEISCRLLFESTLYHPTVMLRREMVERYSLHYDPEYPYGQDYELWCRCARLFRLANLDEVLLRYRIHEMSVSRRKQMEQLATSSLVRTRLLSELGINPSREEIAIHDALALWKTPVDPDFLDRALVWLLHLQVSNQKRIVFAEPLFSSMLAERWYHTCEHATSLGIVTMRFWFHSPLRKLYKVSWLRQFQFLVKCLVRD